MVTLSPEQGCHDGGGWAFVGAPTKAMERSFMHRVAKLRSRRARAVAEAGLVLAVVHTKVHGGGVEAAQGSARRRRSYCWVVELPVLRGVLPDVGHRRRVRSERTI